MPRRRLAVALLFDDATAAVLDRRRRSLGVDDLDRIAPHITVIPPVDLNVELVDPTWSAVVEACRGFGPIRLTLGPGATFAPRTPTIHLAVGGEVDRLAELRDRIRRPPFPQREQWAFVPHVTLVERAPDELIDTELAALVDVRLDVVVDAVRLLEHLPRPAGGRNWWRPIDVAPLSAG